LVWVEASEEAGLQRLGDWQPSLVRRETWAEEMDRAQERGRAKQGKAKGTD
jgi:hypothetical protein